MRIASQILALAAISAATASAVSTPSTTTPATTPTPTPSPAPTPTPKPAFPSPECEPGYLCQDPSSPVCGSDGNTYPSDCDLLVAQCTFSWIVKVFDGECPSPIPIPTPFPVCEPGITCPPDEEPVCGSDGITYTNRCVFSVARCADPSLEIIGDGGCRGMIPPTPNPSCDDGYVCQPVRDPVCGSDGKTYNNKCELNVAQCKSDSLVIAGGGQCTSNAFDCSSTCQTTQDFVCGSDGKTYDNECFLQRAKYCSPGDTSLAVIFNGACPTRWAAPAPVDTSTANGWATAVQAHASSPPTTPSSTTTAGQARTSMPLTTLSSTPAPAACDRIACTRERKPVCGSDGKTYSNECQLRRVQCSDSKLTLVATGECSSSPTASSTSRPTSRPTPPAYC